MSTYYNVFFFIKFNTNCKEKLIYFIQKTIQILLHQQSHQGPNYSRKMSDSNVTQSLGIVTRSGLVLKPYVKPSKPSTNTPQSQNASLGTQDVKEDVPQQFPQSAYVETKEEREWRLEREEEEWWSQYEWRCKKELSAMGI